MQSKFFKSNFSIFTFAFLIVTLSSNAFAWGDEGHKITVRIAANYLSPAAQKEVIRLLKVDAGNNEPYYKQKCPDVLELLKKINLSAIEETTVLSNGLACVASWADPPVKRQRQYTSNWHFVDIPVVMATSSTPILFSYNAARDCRADAEKGDCAIQALERFQPVLADYKDAAATDGHQYGEELTTRAEALKFFIHIMGDIHQPMHCATDKTDKAAVNNPKNVGDMGGNLKYVTWFGVDKTPFGANELHAVWDEGFIGHTMEIKKMSETQYVQYLIGLISESAMNELKTEPPNFTQWVNDSYKMSVYNAYGKLPKLDSACKITTKDNKTGLDKTVTGCYRLSEDYYNTNNPIIEYQLRIGGMRLATLLNAILKT